MEMLLAVFAGLGLSLLVFIGFIKVAIWGLKVIEGGVRMAASALRTEEGVDAGGLEPEASEVAKLKEEANPEPAPLPWWEDPATDPGERHLFRLVLQDGAPLDRLLFKDGGSVRVLQSLLGVGLLGLVSFTGLVGWLAGVQGDALTLDMAHWFGQLPLITFPMAMAAAFLLTLAICIPSFYFYTQIAGVDAPLTLITAQALRVQARTGVLLLGGLPFFGVVALAGHLGIVSDPEWVIGLGVAAPFLVGVFGLYGLLRSFRRLVDVLPITHPRRGILFQGFILAWGGLYAVVSPVAVYRIGEALAINVVV